MAMMMSDQIGHLHVIRDVATCIPNSSELIHLSHRMRLWSFEELRFSEEANKATSSEKRNSSKSQRVTIRTRPTYAILHICITKSYKKTSTDVLNVRLWHP